MSLLKIFSLVSRWLSNKQGNTVTLYNKRTSPNSITRVISGSFSDRSSFTAFAVVVVEASRDWMPGIVTSTLQGAE